MEWIGGLNLPANVGGRVNATWPLGRMYFDAAGLLLAARGPLRWLVKDRRAGIAEVQNAQEVRGSFGSRGVRLRARGRGTWYFWTGRPQVVLTALREVGVEILDGCPKLPLFYSDAWN